MGTVQMRFARWINKRNGWSGHLWANRYFSTPLEDAHLWNVIRYIELNPVRAGLVERAEDYPWSSARAHCGLSQDPLLSNEVIFASAISDWSDYLGQGLPESTLEIFRRNTLTGRPTGSDEFVRRLESETKRRLRPHARGRKRKPNEQ